MTHPMLFDSKTVIPIYLDALYYREWELTVGDQDFCIVNEGGEDGFWTLMQWRQDGRFEGGQCHWLEVGSGEAVDAFLKTHPVILGN